MRRRALRVIAALVFVGSVASVMVAQRDVGIARDEATYMHFGERYAHFWIDGVAGDAPVFDRKRIEKHFGGKAATDGNREHPPLVKTAAGLSSELFSKRLGWMSELTAFRFPGAVCFGLVVLFSFGMARRFWGFAAGLAAAAMVATLPRLFFHATLYTFDVPVVAAWMACMVAYIKTLENPRWVVGMALCYGLALGVKHNAFMFPAVWWSHYAWLTYSRYVRGAGKGKLGALLRGLGWEGAVVLVAPIIGGLVVLFAVWPWMWFDTVAHFGDWLRFHLHHVHYNFEYLGANWNAPPFPWHFPVVSLLLTIPLATLVATPIGAAELWRTRGKTPLAPGLLIALSFCVAIGPFLLMSTPIFGGTKHYLVAAVMIALVGGVGVSGAAKRMAASLHRRTQQAVVVALLAVVLGAGVYEVTLSQPYGLTHYNAVAGGASGGADLGMNRQYWGLAARGALDAVNSRAGRKVAKLYTHDASPAIHHYLRSGELAPNVRDAGHERSGVRRSHLAIVVHEKHFLRHDVMIWDVYKTATPVFVLTHGGVPVVTLYEKPRAPRR